MLKILFSPSEAKNSGGTEIKKELFGTQAVRKEILNQYNNIIRKNDKEEIKKLFGFKKFSECEIYTKNIFNSPLMSAIQRYQGVAYNYLQFESLNCIEQKYLKDNTIIFSNLYGPLLGGDTIPNYKVKQGNNIGNIIPDKFYKKNLSSSLDIYLSDFEILDLRAGYYEKFYKINKPYTSLKFLKHGKSISHWAKAYRGIILRELAKNNINTLDDFISLEIDNLIIKEIKIIKNKQEIVYDIV